MKYRCRRCNRILTYEQLAVSDDGFTCCPVCENLGIETIKEEKDMAIECLRKPMGENKLEEVLDLLKLKIGEPFKVQYKKCGQWVFSDATFIVNRCGGIQKLSKLLAPELFLSQIITGEIKVRSLYEQLPKIGFDKTEVINNQSRVRRFVNEDCIRKSIITDFGEER